MAVIYVGGSSQYSTIQQGIQAAEQTGATTVIVNAGTYTGNDVLSSADNGLTISGSQGVSITGSFSISNASSVTLSGLSFQGNGSNVAVTATNSQSLSIVGNNFTGTGQAVLLDGSTNSSVSNNSIFNTTASAIEAKNGANSNLFSSNTINGDTTPGTIGAIYLHGANNSTVTHNQITNTTGAAISLSDFFGPGTTGTQNNGSVVSFNSLNQVDTTAPDSGAIYILGRSQEQNANITVSNNLIQNVGSAAAVGSPTEHAVGIYLDDNTSGVSVTSNVVIATATLTDPFEIHGGSNDTISGNIFDLTSGVTDFGLFQQDPANQAPVGSFAQLVNDNITGNIFATEAASPHNPGYADLTGGIGQISIAGNNYWAFSGAPLNVAGTNAAGDSAAQYNPPAAHAAQSISDYAAWSAPGINFQAIDVADIGLLPSSITLVSEPASILLLPVFLLAVLLKRRRQAQPNSFIAHGAFQILVMCAIFPSANCMTYT